MEVYHLWPNQINRELYFIRFLWYSLFLTLSWFYFFLSMRSRITPTTITIAITMAIGKIFFNQPVLLPQQIIQNGFNLFADIIYPTTLPHYGIWDRLRTCWVLKSSNSWEILLFSVQRKYPSIRLLWIIPVAISVLDIARIWPSKWNKRYIFVDQLPFQLQMQKKYFTRWFWFLFWSFFYDLLDRNLWELWYYMIYENNRDGHYLPHW